MKKNYWLLSLCLLFSLSAFGQGTIDNVERGKIIHPSPTAASLGKYGEYPVSLYSGMVNIGQELLQIKSGSLSLNIGLRYHSGGNKPSDIPGWVGLGFSLDAGGVITRVVRDLPDDEQEGFVNSLSERNTLMPNLLPGTSALENYIDRRLDPKSDRYQFNFAGRSGEFFFDWNNNIRFTRSEQLKIEYTTDFGRFKSFLITDERGIVYVFDKVESSKYTRYDNFRRNYASSWYLSKIKSLAGDSIVLKYTEPSQYSRFKLSVSEKSFRGIVDGGWQGNDEKYIGHNEDEVIYLDEIIFNGGKVTFPKSLRTDPYYTPSSGAYAQEKKLDSVILWDDKGNKKKQWQLQYFENTTERLKLKDLILTDGNGQGAQHYKFEYNPVKLPVESIVEPDPYITNKIDYWGYYNNNQSSSPSRIPLTYSAELQQYLGGADRKPDATRMKAEILSKIIYPTGGYTTFEFEPNDYSSEGESMGTSPPEAVWQYLEFIYEDGYFNEDPYSMTFTLTSPTLVTISKYVKRSGPNTAWLPLPSPSEVIQSTFQPGTYNLGVILNANGLLEPESNEIWHATGQVAWLEAVTPPNPEPGTVTKMAGGLRIKSITNFDGISTSVRSFIYEWGNGVSTGMLSVFPAYYANLHDFWHNTYGLFVSSEPLNAIPDGSPVGYKYVKEIFPDSSYIEHEFTSYEEYPDQFNSFYNGYTNEKLSPLSSMTYMRGFEKKTSIYNSEGELLKTVLNTQDSASGASQDLSAVDIRTTVTFLFPDHEGNLISNPIAGIVTAPSTIFCRFMHPKSTEEIIYDNSITPARSISQQKKTFYDNPQHLQPTRIETIKSDGSKETTCITYADDYAGGTAFIDYLKTNHLIALPIEQVVYREKAGVVTILSGTITKYKTSGGGLVDEVLKLETAAAIPLANFRFSSRAQGILPNAGTPAAFNPDGHYASAIVYDSYDDHGNPLQLTVRNGAPLSYIWSYKGKYPVAEVQNAVQADIACANFEADGKGNWNYSGAVAEDNTTPAGRKCYNLAGGTVTKTGLAASKEYVLTYWAKSATAGSISGGTAEAMTSKSGWTMYRRVFTGVTSVTISGNILVDEIRLHPKNAIMTGYTYDVLTGMTSQMDGSGRISYYEYDGLQRLKTIRDQDGKIIKQFDYQYDVNP